MGAKQWRHARKKGLRKSGGVLQVAGFLMVTMMISRVLGYVRDVVLLTNFGQTYQTDAYYAAFNIPDFIYYILVGGALSSAFIPIFSSYLARGQEEDSWTVASTVVNLVLIGVTAGIAVGMVFTPQLIALLAPGYDAQTQALAVLLTRVMFAQCFFMCLNGISQGILHSYKQFGAPALGSMLYNAAIIVVGVLLHEQLGVLAFSLGVVVGAFLNLAVQVPTLLRIGVHYRPVLALDHPGVRQFFRLLGPVLLGLSVIHLNVFIGTNLGSGLGEGVVTALSNAQRLMQLPVGIFAIAIALAIFPNMTANAAKGEMALYKKELSLGLRTIVFITLPAAVGLAILRVPLVRAMYYQGSFSLENLDLTASALLFYCIGLVGYSAQQLLNRGFYAIQDTRSPVMINIGVILLNIVLSVALVGPLGYKGLATAYSVAGLASMAALLVGLRRKVGQMDGRLMVTSFVKSAAAAAVMAVAVVLLSGFLENVWDIAGLKWAQIAQVVLCIAVGAVVYGGAALAMRMEEMGMVAAVVRKKLRRR